MSDAEHARLSPSSMSRRIQCPGSLALEEQCPKTTSRYAEEGTAAHEVAQWCLTEAAPFASIYEGRTTKNGWVVTEEMTDYVQVFVDNVRLTVQNFEAAGATVTLLVEQRVDFTHVIGVPDSFGTSDIVMIVEFKDGSTLIGIEDLKYGMGVKVDAQENDQLRTYALAVLDEYALAYDVQRVRLVIHQPRLDHLSEDEIDVAELQAWAGIMIPAARKALDLADKLVAENVTVAGIDQAGLLVPSEKSCQFCRAKAYCPALARKAFETVADGFVDLDAEESELKSDLQAGIIKLDEGMITTAQAAKIGFLVDLIEDYCRAIRGRIEAELFAGIVVPGWKLVTGRRGWRAWSNKELVEDLLKSMRYKREEMYDFKLISPAKAEKMLEKDNPRRWNKLKKLVTQPDGRPSIAPESDKRPAYIIPDVSKSFDDLDDNEDLA